MTLGKASKKERNKERRENLGYYKQPKITVVSKNIKKILKEREYNLKVYQKLNLRKNEG